MRKNLLTLLLAIVAGWGTMHASVVNGTCGDNLTWLLNTADSTLTISGTGAMTNYTSSDAPWKTYSVIVKYVVIENGVTLIGSRAFLGCNTMISVTIPNSVTSIGNYAFFGCSRCTSIEIPNSVTSIGDNAFEDCGLKHVSIPNSVTSIGSHAFEGCFRLTSIEIPNSVTSIEGSTFYGCTGLNSVTIGNSITSIGSYAFYRCSGLTSIEIPNSVISIGGNAFYDCSSLISIKIPNSVISIGSDAFNSCSSLTFIEIPNSVTSIGMRAFSYCRGLTSVKLGNGISEISSRVFQYCNSLVSIEIPSNVIRIGDYVFSGCSNLTSLILPNQLTNIGSSAFSDCSGLKLITNYNEVPISITSRDFQYVNKNICTLYVPEESIILYQNATGWNEFYNIRPIGSALAVQFVDWNGTVLSTDYVNSGEAATAPANPSREGYTFTGWDKDFSNVMEDLTVTAQYEINRYRVRFYDWDGTLLKTDSADWQSAAIAPATPARPGYTFAGWDKSFEAVTADLDVTALYEKEQFNVTISYIDGADNSLIDSENIVLTLPDAPVHEGYVFLGWEIVASGIEAGISIRAVYESSVPSAVASMPAEDLHSHKLLQAGQVLILRGDKIYSITGNEIQ